MPSCKPTLPSHFLPPAVVGLWATEDDIEALFPEELACISPKAVPVRQRDFRLGRSAAHQALRALGHPAVPIRVGPHASPLWPTGIIGSISHAGGYAIALAARQTALQFLGVDVEVRRDQCDPSLVAMVADPVEQQWIGKDPDRFITLFSAKESIFKALYPSYGDYFDFNAVHLQPSPQGFLAALRQSLGPRWPVGSTLSVNVCPLEGLILTAVAC